MMGPVFRVLVAPHAWGKTTTQAMALSPARARRSD